MNNNRTISKNVIFLYTRMLVVMGISLYTSRIVLRDLGAVNYGIYNVVAGTSTMFTFLLSALSISTQRFFALKIIEGKNDLINKTFSLVIWIHILLAIIIVTISELSGFFLINETLNIPKERINASILAFHSSNVIILTQVLVAPIIGLFIAYEKMKVITYISIIESILKLFFIFLLEKMQYDKLIAYSSLMAIVSIIIFLLYVILLKRYFLFLRLKFYTKSSEVRDIISFSSWNVLSSLSSVLSNQGINILINVFFGPTTNAARAIAVQLSGAIGGFTSNIQIAVNPQIIKSWGRKEIDEFNLLILNSSKFTFILILVILCPVYLELPIILSTWLGKIPDNTIIFCRTVFLQITILSLSRSYITGINAIGMVKKLNILASGALLLVVPVTYYLYTIKFLPYIAFVVYAIALTVEFVVSLKILKTASSLNFSKFFKICLLPILKTFCLGISLPVLIHYYFEDGYIRVLLVCITSLTCFGIGTYAFMINAEIRDKLLLILNNVFEKCRFAI
nr:oligosaccharide flippase family protein [uncultured Spirosoma sp.]